MIEFTHARLADYSDRIETYSCGVYETPQGYAVIVEIAGKITRNSTYKRFSKAYSEYEKLCRSYASWQLTDAVSIMPRNPPKRSKKDVRTQRKPVRSEGG